MMEPTVGRIVHYHSVASEDAECQAAIVTKVWGPNTVNLEVFGQTHGAGEQRFRTSVTRVDTGEIGMGWHWPERID